MVNMLVSSGTEAEEVPEKMKTKIQQQIHKGMKLGIKTAESFNSLSTWSIKRKPHNKDFIRGSL